MTRRDTALVLTPVKDGGQRIFGLTSAARLRRLFARAGVEKTITPQQAGQSADPLIIARADAVIDPPLVDVIMARPGLVLLDSDTGKPLIVHAPAGQAKAALDILSGAPIPDGFAAHRPDELGIHYWKALRKREAPSALILRPQNRTQVEWRIFMGTYKGVTDVITRHVWPRPAFHVTRWLAGTPVTPNMVTALSALFVLAAFWLFWRGEYGWGLVCAWLMTFLDTVDGKLARTTLTSSTWGNIFDHGIDLIHPPFWYVAWGMGLQRAGHPLDARTWWIAIWVIIAGYVLQRVMEGIALGALKLDIHTWRPIDSFFRKITARRNPNLVILTLFALVERPDIGLLAVAAWTAICLILHAVQIVQALVHKRRAGQLVSWMEKEET